MSSPTIFRNNNFGAIRGNYFGATGTDPRGFAIYPTPEAGWNALSTQLDRYYQGKTTGSPLRTVREIVSTWAPPSQNNTEAYVKRVARDVGVDPDVALPWTDEVKRKVMAAIASHEVGKPLTPYSGGSSLSPVQETASMNPMTTPSVMDFLRQNTALGQQPGAPGMGDAPMSPLEGQLFDMLSQQNQGILDLSKTGAETKQKPSFATDLMANPMIQMGLGILTADPKQGPFRAIASGVQQGLNTASAAEQQQIGLEEKRQQEERHRMWQRVQIMQAQRNMLSEAAARQQAASPVTMSVREGLDAYGMMQGNQGGARAPDLKAIYDQMGRQVEVVDVNTPEGLAKAMAAPGQGYSFNSIGARKGESMDQRMEEARYILDTSGFGGGNETPAAREKWQEQEAAVEGLDATLTSVLGQAVNNKDLLGTAGRLVGGAVTAAGVVDSLVRSKTGGDPGLREAVVKRFGDPNLLTQEQRLRVQQVARAYVDRAGPLTGQEQNKARELIGLLEDGVQDPETVLNTMVALLKANDEKRAQNYRSEYKYRKKIHPESITSEIEKKYQWAQDILSGNREKYELRRPAVDQAAYGKVIGAASPVMPGAPGATRPKDPELEATIDALFKEIGGR